jgi:hypothetical protein
MAGWAAFLLIPFFLETPSFLAATFGDKREKGRFQKVAKQV